MSTDDKEFVSFYFRTGFQDAVILLSSSEEKLNLIADYCLANLDREIAGAEIIEACDL